jgi:hypothetical protein
MDWEGGMATFAEYLGNIDIDDILNKLESVNPNVAFIRNLPKGKYRVMARFNEKRQFVQLELDCQK